MSRRKIEQKEQEIEIKRKLIRISKKVCMSFILGCLGYLSSQQTIDYNENGVDYLPKIFMITSSILLSLSCYMGFTGCPIIRKI